ncbi:helix-turn-helix transcriptional regulator [Serinibacter arcticus]|nr:WYL domain-containing protein [Serinibacter arcticus]
MSAPSSRTLLLLSLLQTRRDWAGPELARRLAVSDRTVRRDVDRLRTLGYRVTPLMGPDGGYRLEAGADLPPLLFDDEQAVAVAVALRMAAVSGVEIGDDAARAMRAVRQLMPARLRHRIDAVEVTPLPRRDGAPAVDPDALTAVSAAVRAREVLRLDYDSPEGDRAGSGDPGAAPPPPRRVEPHHVVTHEGRWYLVAWDLDRRDWHTLRLDRLTPRSPTGPRFGPREIPGGDVGAWVGARFRGAPSEGGQVTDSWPCWGEVVLDLPLRRVLPFVADGAAREMTPERTHLRSGSWSWIALAAELGRFDAALEVLGPPELADALVTLSERFARAAPRRP